MEIVLGIIVGFILSGFYKRIIHRDYYKKKRISEALRKYEIDKKEREGQ